MRSTITRWTVLAATLGCGILPFRSFGQQDPMYTLYMWNMMAIDPGYAGSADVFNATALSRLQWTGIQGAPVTHSLSAHAPVNKRTLGLGLTAVNDRIGRATSTAVFADLAYRVRLGRNTRLAFGLKVGADHSQLANTRVENTDAADPLFASDVSGKLLPNFGFGLYLWSQKGYVGLSTPKLLRNYLATNDRETNTLGYTQEAPHLFLTGGYVFPIGRGVKFKPAVMVKATQGAPLSPDLSANFFFMDRLCLGAAYRRHDSFSGIVSLQVTDAVRAGYAYDLGTSALASRSGGSHEIMVAYAPVFTRERVRSPRYF